MDNVPLDNVAFIIIVAGIGVSLVVAIGTAIYDTDLIIRNTTVSFVTCAIVFSVLFDVFGLDFHIIVRLAIVGVAVFLILTVWPEK